MEMCMEMSKIECCEVSECTYNLNSACNAKAITVGDGTHPGCDTFMHASQHVSNTTMGAGVGACKVSGCQHNSDFECSAENIRVGHQSGSPCCQTYAAS